MKITEDNIFINGCNHVFSGASKALVDFIKLLKKSNRLLGNTEYDLFPEEYADILYRQGKLVFTGIPLVHEFYDLLNGTGNIIWLENHQFPIRDANDTIIGVLGIASLSPSTKKLMKTRVEKNNQSG